MIQCCFDLNLRDVSNIFENRHKRTLKCRVVIEIEKAENKASI